MDTTDKIGIIKEKGIGRSSKECCLILAYLLAYRGGYNTRYSASSLFRPRRFAANASGGVFCLPVLFIVTWMQSPGNQRLGWQL